VELAINAAVSTSTTMSQFKTTLAFEQTSPTAATIDDNERNRTLPEQVENWSKCTDLLTSASRQLKRMCKNMQIGTGYQYIFTFGDKIRLKDANLHSSTKVRTIFRTFANINAIMRRLY
jgi:hypothetical protein